MYVVFLIYCFCFVLFVLLQLVSYPYLITDCLFIFSEVELFFSLSIYACISLILTLVTRIMKMICIKDFNIIKTFLK